MIGRHFFSTCCVSALVGAVALAVRPPGIVPAARLMLVGGLVLYAALCGLAAHLSTRARFPMSAALGVTALAAMLLIGWVSVVLGEGLRNPAFGFFGLIVCVVGAITGVRLGVALALAAATLLALGAWAQAVHLIPGGTGPMPLGMVLAFQWLIVLCSVVGGALIARALNLCLGAAAERERRFHGLLRVAADWYWEMDRELRLSHVSETGAGAPGIAPVEHVGRKLWEIANTGLGADQLDALQADLEAHRRFGGVIACRRDAEGRLRYQSMSGEPRFDASGVFRGYLGAARDVTDEVRLQRALAASEARYRELFARSPSPLVLHRRGVVLDANEAAARLFAFPDAAAMNGIDSTGLFPAGVARDRVIERLAQLEGMAVGGSLPVSDTEACARDGRSLFVQATAVRVDAAGGPANLSIFFDITARLAVENALRRSEAMLSHLVATSPDCITLTEVATGRYMMVNEAFYRITGYEASEVIGHTAEEIGIWNDPRDRALLLETLRRDGMASSVPIAFRTKSGGRVSMLVSAARFTMNQRDYLVINSRDRTESERTRLEYAAILERASIGIAFTRDRRFVQANLAMETMFGWRKGELIGQPGLAVWPDEQAYADINRQARPLLSAGQPFEGEFRMRRRDGSTFWCRLLARSVDPDDPAHGGTIWIGEDVTEKRRIDQELAAARDAAEAASRAKSAFLANTSHEIRTPLNGLLGLARLAMQADLPEARRQQYLAQIVDSAESLGGIMSDILDVSKIEAGKFALEDTPFDLRDALKAVHHAYDALAAVKGLALLLDIDEQLPATVRGDPLRVRQILSNFITNALKFTERGHVRIAATLRPDGAVRLAVSDTGPGVPDETQARLFRPFSQGDSSTTRRYGGTGLGLSICRELAHLMGGAVGMESTPGHGSTFWADLPLPSSAPVQRSASTEASEIADLADARVLMAEDNPVNMMIAVAMLEHWGVHVEQAHDGRAAIDAVHAAAGQGRPFDVVLMDVQMPVMGGHEAARELRRHYAPEALPIVALTAAALVSERAEALDAGMNDFLTKPIDASKLRRTLAALVPARRVQAR
jgi:PAS domain S-box-containing protein